MCVPAPLSNTCVVLDRCRYVPRKVTRARTRRLGTAPLRYLPSPTGQLLDPPPGQFPGVHKCWLCVNAAAVVWVYAPAVLFGLACAVVCVKKLLCISSPGLVSALAVCDLGTDIWAVLFQGAHSSCSRPKHKGKPADRA